MDGKWLTRTDGITHYYDESEVYKIEYSEITKSVKAVCGAKFDNIDDIVVDAEEINCEKCIDVLRNQEKKTSTKYDN